MSRQSSPWPSAPAVCPRGREVSRTKNFLASQVASGSVAGRAALLHSLRAAKVPSSWKSPSRSCRNGPHRRQLRERRGTAASRSRFAKMLQKEVRHQPSDGLRAEPGRREPRHGVATGTAVSTNPVTVPSP